MLQMLLMGSFMDAPKTLLDLLSSLGADSSCADQIRRILNMTAPLKMLETLSQNSRHEVRNHLHSVLTGHSPPRMQPLVRTRVHVLFARLPHKSIATSYLLVSKSVLIEY